MTKRRCVPTYVPVLIEAQQPNGEWWVRNSFNYQNAKVQTGEKSRDWLVALAVSVMIEWNGDKPLRVTGQKTGE